MVRSIFKMKKINIKEDTIILVVYSLIVTLSSAQTGGPYDLTWNTIDSGGDTSTSGQYSLTGTIGYAGGQSSGGDFMLTSVIGQPEAGIISGGDYDLLGGFLPGRPVCIVEFRHFARFAEYWLEMDCEEPDWCDGADLNQLDGVDLADLGLFIDEWLDYCSTDWPLK
jgi:hypothetical protein